MRSYPTMPRFRRQDSCECTPILRQRYATTQEKTMTFRRPIDAIEWWFECLQGGGVPLMNTSRVQEEFEYFERVQTSRQRWLPHDDLCTYIDIGKALEKLSNSDQAVIISYLLEVVGVHDQQHLRTGYWNWKYRKEWGLVTKKFWRLLPKEYKNGYRR